MKKYSVELANQIRDFMEQDDWKFTFLEERGVFKTGVRIDGKLKRVDYIIEVYEDDYVVYALSPIGADVEEPETLEQLNAFVNRANYGLRLGNFELDNRDGELRYKVTVMCMDTTPSRTMLRRSIYCPAMMFERYGDGITQILFNGMDAETACERCEDAPVISRHADEIVSAITEELEERLNALFEDNEEPEDALEVPLLIDRDEEDPDDPDAPDDPDDPESGGAEPAEEADSDSSSDITDELIMNLFRTRRRKEGGNA